MQLRLRNEAHAPGDGAGTVADFVAGGTTTAFHVPANVPAANYWSMVLYDADTPSLLDNGQPFPSISSNSNLKPNADGSADRIRRRKAGVPREISFKTKPQIALEQLCWACEAGLPRGVVLMDAGYGADTDVRANITTLGLSYVAGIMPNTTRFGHQARGRCRRRIVHHER